MGNYGLTADISSFITEIWDIMCFILNANTSFWGRFYMDILIQDRPVGAE